MSCTKPIPALVLDLPRVSNWWRRPSVICRSSPRKKAARTQGRPAVQRRRLAGGMRAPAPVRGRCLSPAARRFRAETRSGQGQRAQSVLSVVRSPRRVHAGRSLQCRLCQRYGIHGRIFSMGDRFDGTLKLDADTFPPAPAPRSRSMNRWITGAPRRPASTTAWRLPMPSSSTATASPLTQAGTRKITSVLPYSQPTSKPSISGRPPLGWFEETRGRFRAGDLRQLHRDGRRRQLRVPERRVGAGPPRSGCSNPRTDGNDSYPQGVAQVAELHRMEITSLREDRRMLGSVRQPEGGAFKGRQGDSAISAAAIRISTRNCPRAAIRSPLVRGVCDLVADAQDHRCRCRPRARPRTARRAEPCNYRPTAPSPMPRRSTAGSGSSWGRRCSLLRSAMRNCSANRSSSASITIRRWRFPDQGCSLTAGISLYPVFAEGPASHKDSPHTGTDDHAIALGNASCLPSTGACSANRHRRSPGSCVPS